MSEIALSWMLTYLLHSTLLLGGAWVAWKLLPDEALAVKETLWRTALLGGIFTASLQAGLAVEPGLGSWRLGSSTGRDPLSLVVPVSRPATSEASHVAISLSSSEPSRAETVVAPRERAESPGIDAAATSVPPTGWSRWILAAWAIGVLATVGWLAVSCLALAGRLKDRRVIAAGRLRALLVRLQKAARMTGVVLSASARIGSPMAFGWRRREICLPERVASNMTAEQQELILAHELAHHARRDPVWLLAGRLIECALFFQPLNRIAGRRLREIAEYRCDDWAVEHTGRPITLARCLADVAEWSLRSGAPLPVPTLAAERGRLGRRVARLLDRGYPFPAAGRPRWLATGVTLTLVLVVLLAPGVSSGHAPLAPDPPGAPDALEVSEVPEIPEAVPVPPVPIVQIEPPVPMVQTEPLVPIVRTEPPVPIVQTEPPSPVVQTEPPSPVVAPPPPSLVMTAPTPVLPPSPPGPPGAQVAPVEIPASPLPPADPGNGGWVLHDDPWLVFSSGPHAALDRLRAKLEERGVAQREEVARLREDVRRRIEGSRSQRRELARLREALRHHVEERRLELDRVRMLEEARRLEWEAER